MRFSIFLVIFVFGISFCPLANAHPPGKIDVEFRHETKTVYAVIYHRVHDTKVHYIQQVDIRVNEKRMIKYKLTEQDNELTESINIQIPGLKAGDVVSVKAHCSIGGELTKEFLIQEEQ